MQPIRRGTFTDIKATSGGVISLPLKVEGDVIVRIDSLTNPSLVTLESKIAVEKNPVLQNYLTQTPTGQIGYSPNADAYWEPSFATQTAGTHVIAGFSTRDYYRIRIKEGDYSESDGTLYAKLSIVDPTLPSNNPFTLGEIQTLIDDSLASHGGSSTPIPDQTILGNDSGDTGLPAPLTVEQVSDILHTQTVKINSSLTSLETKIIEIFPQNSTRYALDVDIIASNSTNSSRIQARVLHDQEQTQGRVLDQSAYVDDSDTDFFTLSSISTIQNGRIAVSVTNLTTDDLTVTLYIN